MNNPRIDEATFEALRTLREVAERTASSARDYGENLERDGWDPHMAQHMAYQYFTMVMTFMIGSARGGSSDDD